MIDLNDQKQIKKMIINIHLFAILVFGFAYFIFPNTHYLFSLIVGFVIGEINIFLLAKLVAGMLSSDSHQGKGKIAILMVAKLSFLFGSFYLALVKFGAHAIFLIAGYLLVIFAIMLQNVMSSSSNE